MGILTLNNSILTLNGSALTLSSAPIIKCVNFVDVSTTCPNFDAYEECAKASISASPSMSTSENYCICLSFGMYKAASDSPYLQYVCVECNGYCLYYCEINTQPSAYCSGNFPAFQIYNGDNVCVTTYASIDNEFNGGAFAQAYINTITAGSCGCFCVGDDNILQSSTLSM
ncbi:MAG: hypothetical protein ACOXZV_05905 [Bacteroidales bacterium]|jgi:hypothetical protein